MRIQVCFSHQQTQINGIWGEQHEFNIFMLWIKQPMLIGHCPECDKEINLRETINALRQREEP